MTSEVKMREAFEQAMAREGYELSPAKYRDGTYRSAEYAAGWAMWQAARVEARAKALEEAAEECERVRRLSMGFETGNTCAGAIRSLAKDAAASMSPGVR